MRSRTTSILLKAVADGCLAAVTLAVGLGVRLLAEAFERPARDPLELLGEYMRYFDSYAPLLAVSIVVTVFAIRMRTRDRLYTRRENLIGAALATSLGYIAFALGVYFLKQPVGGQIPRGALLIAYTLTLTGVGGKRLLVDYLQKAFAIESTTASAERSIRKVLVVGGAGYIGSGLVRDLLAEGYRVRVLDRLLYGDDSIRDLYHEPFCEFIQGDFRDVTPVVKAVKGVDAVIHLGAIVGDPACAVSEDETLATNLAATRLLADVCRASGVSRLLFASTCSVYGAAEEVVHENSELNPVSLYAATKIDSERVLLDAKCPDLHPVIMRLATAFGWSHRPRFDLVVNLLTAKAAQEKKIVIFNGQQWRPFIHIKDISRAFRAALCAPLDLVSGEVFNVGSDNMNLTLRELAEKIRDIEPELEVDYIDNSDARTYKVCFDKIRTRLGFTCEVTVDDGIAEIRRQLTDGAVPDYRDVKYSNVQVVRQLQQVVRLQPQAVELTALRFAKNGVWVQTAVQGISRW